MGPLQMAPSHFTITVVLSGLELLCFEMLRMTIFRTVPSSQDGPIQGWLKDELC